MFLHVGKAESELKIQLDRAIHEAAIEIKEESISNIYERIKTKVMMVLAGEELPLN